MMQWIYRGKELDELLKWQKMSVGTAVVMLVKNCTFYKIRIDVISFSTPVSLSRSRDTVVSVILEFRAGDTSSFDNVQ